MLTLILRILLYQQVITSTESSQHFPKLNTVQLRSRSNSVEKVAHTQDEMSEMHYAIVN